MRLAPEPLGEPVDLALDVSGKEICGFNVARNIFSRVIVRMQNGCDRLELSEFANLGPPPLAPDVISELLARLALVLPVGSASWRYQSSKSKPVNNEFGSGSRIACLNGRRACRSLKQHGRGAKCTGAKTQPLAIRT